MPGKAGPCSRLGGCTLPLRKAGQQGLQPGSPPRHPATPLAARKPLNRVQHQPVRGLRYRCPLLPPTALALPRSHVCQVRLSTGRWQLWRPATLSSQRGSLPVGRGWKRQQQWRRQGLPRQERPPCPHRCRQRRGRMASRCRYPPAPAAGEQQELAREVLTQTQLPPQRRLKGRQGRGDCQGPKRHKSQPHVLLQLEGCRRPLSP
mmetsp:Transcript_9951/g.28536  ORF Transcript_9951/g.28536 Transcript_9951/m.28536 type:complete len:205 (+) Transcript_9951:318-932(+)